MRRPQKTARAQKTARGFTIVEVMVAVIITAFGFAAIFSLQIGSMQGNISARDLSSGVNLAERYAEMLRTDAFMWTAGPATAIPYPASRTQGANGQPASNWLNKAGGVWHPIAFVPMDQNGQVHVDDDAVNGTALARQRFCVHYRVDPLGGNFDGVLSARVRAIWPRSSMDISELRADNVCGNPQAFDDDPDKVAKWFSVTVPTTIRRHPR